MTLGVSVPFDLYMAYVISVPSYVSSQIFPITTCTVYSTIYQIRVMTPHGLGVPRPHL